MKLIQTLVLGIVLGRTSAGVLSVNSRAGQFITIGDAIKAAKPGDTVYIGAGVYKEKLTIDKDNITLKGGSFPSTDPAQNSVSIQASNYATDTDDDSATLFIKGSNVKIYNINITNAAPFASRAAVAISTRGNNNGFYTVSALGVQGVFYAHVGSAFIARSYIQGSVDSVYGRIGNAWFQGVKLGATGAGGSLTAQGRMSADQDGYFVFDKAKIVVGKNADTGTKGSVYLGRPWGVYARAVFQNSNLGNVISDAGWNTYNDTQDTRHVLFAEYGNTNGGELTLRVSWEKSLAKATDISTVLPGYRDWVDSGYIGVNSP